MSPGDVLPEAEEPLALPLCNEEAMLFSAEDNAFPSDELIAPEEISCCSSACNCCWGVR